MLVKKACWSSATSLRKPYAAAETGTPMIAARTRSCR
jgi:hypothetical protein